MRSGSALYEAKTGRSERVASKNGLSWTAENSQVVDERDCRESNLGRAAELRSEVGGQVLRELVLQDGGADGDPKDLSKRSSEAEEGHLRENNGSARARLSGNRSDTTHGVRLLRGFEGSEDGEVGARVENSESDSHEDRARETKDGQRERREQKPSVAVNRRAYYPTQAFIGESH